jgi:iron(III) transport system permease protein
MGDLPKGAGLAIILLVPALSAFLLQRYWVSRKSYVTVTGKSFPRRAVKTPPLLKALLLGAMVSVCATVVLFYGTLVAGSFVRLWGVDFTLTLQHFAYVWDVGFETLKDTVILAAVATPFTGFLGMVIAFLLVRKEFPGKRALEVISLLTFAVPGTVVGIGYILAFNHWPVLLVGTPAIIVLSLIFRYVPVGIEAGVAALRQIAPEIEHASVNLGAGTFYTFRKVTLPLIEPAFFAGLAYSFVRSMTAISAIIFLVSARWNHLTVLILAQTEILRLGAASVLCLVLIVVVMTALLLIQRMAGFGRLQAFQ